MKEKMLKLYHGSSVAVRKPKLIETGKALDFSTAFYTTDSRKCAYDRAMQSWQLLKDFDRKLCFVSEYCLDEDTVTVKRFEGATEEWFDTLVDARSSGFRSDYDVLVGPIADAFVKRILQDFCLFRDGYLSRGGHDDDLEYRSEKMKALGQLRPKREYDFEQYALTTQWAVDRLEYKCCHAFSQGGIYLKTIPLGEKLNIFELEDLATYRKKKQHKDDMWYGR